MDGFERNVVIIWNCSEHGVPDTIVCLNSFEILCYVGNNSSVSVEAPRMLNRSVDETFNKDVRWNEQQCCYF